jgi:ribonuclease HI
MLYAADVWFRPIYSQDSNAKTRGSIGIITKLNCIQRIALLSITGAMSTTATDELEILANVLPIEHRIQNLCHQATLHITAHPLSHPLYPMVCRAAQCYVKHHRTALHYLIHAYDISSDQIETLIPGCTDPSKPLPHSLHIAPDRTTATNEHDNTQDHIHIYSDGSGTNSKAGAAAILIRPGAPTKTLCYHLGPLMEHTVHKAEAVSLTLATELLSNEHLINPLISIYVDNQAVIKPGENSQVHPSQYIISIFCSHLDQTRRTHKLTKYDITIRWMSGHDGV